jgi:hypothetical protein
MSTGKRMQKNARSIAHFILSIGVGWALATTEMGMILLLLHDIVSMRKKPSGKKVLYIS